MPSHSHGAASAYDALVRAAEAVSARVHGRCAPRGISPGRAATLLALLEGGPPCPRDLAARLGQTPGNITQSVRALERDGLAEARRTPSNRRYCIIRLTPRGRRLARRLARDRALAVAGEMRALPAAELARLRELCTRLS